jgi:hypothetical protein
VIDLVIDNDTNKRQPRVVHMYTTNPDQSNALLGISLIRAFAHISLFGNSKPACVINEKGSSWLSH